MTRFYDLACQTLSDGAARTYLNTLLPYATRLIREAEEAERVADGHRRMPQASGVEGPLPQRTSENYFRLARSRSQAGSIGPQQGEPWA